MLLFVGLITGCGRPSDAPDAAAPTPPPSIAAESEPFLALMNVGKGFLDQGDATHAVQTYLKALKLVPQDFDARLNLANAHLLAGAPQLAATEATRALEISPNSAAAFFVLGSAHLRLGQAEAAVKAFENVRAIDPGETATYFQLGRARMDLKQWNEAITVFREGLALDPNRLHASVHYLLGQCLAHAGRTDEANQELAQHQVGREAEGGMITLATFERSRYTQARVPFRLEQPDPQGVPVRFVDDTARILGRDAGRYLGPAGTLDPTKSRATGLFVLERDSGFRFLRNEDGVFKAHGAPLPSNIGTSIRTVLVGDLQNDRIEDVVVLGDQGVQIFQFDSRQLAHEVPSTNTPTSGAVDGALVDLDFTGKLDLVTVGASPATVQVFRQTAPLHFVEITESTGLPAALNNARGIHFDDWNSDGLPDLAITRADGSPERFEKVRGSRLFSRPATNWVAGSLACPGDFDNDLRPDLAILQSNALVICLASGARQSIPIADAGQIQQVLAIDHDNDGWLDLWIVGNGVRAWRNTGLTGFAECTSALGLDALQLGIVSALVAADFDNDCDLDLVLSLKEGGLRYLRNDGANAHQMVKVQLIGNRSNASGLGCKTEIVSGGLRLLRSVRQLPVEIGIGRHEQLDAFQVHWLNWPQGSTETPVRCDEPILAVEAVLQEGSCPYLYAWDGQRFRFVTDILGASPLGLPVAQGRYIEPDPEELVRIGDESSFPSKDGHRIVSITEELREVLYLDEAQLVVVDRQPGVEVHATDKLLPSGPYVPGSLWTLHSERPLQRAETLDGQEITQALRQIDGQRASPPRLRAPQLRGLAEPHGYVLDFGPLPADRPLVLVLNGWLRFGGGMANIAASQDSTLPYPFPVLEAETAAGHWQKLNVVVGAPAGKTKTIMVDLAGKLQPGSRRLRLTQAFEIHWDRIALLEKQSQPSTQIAWLKPSTARLRPHGFGRLLDLPPDCPPTPDYDRVEPNSPWTIIPEGWSTRHGDVLELVKARDEGLALVHCGDELLLEFADDLLPPRPNGAVREFFLYVDGWDKDSDFHVATGSTVEPLPFHGMDAQRYGIEARPLFPSDALHAKYNTRWVQGTALKRMAKTAR
ncbi:MAG: VCBS repeat-containing protein [Verrucomicrobiales bacterium]|nr:VCBS repeat-containing protein [Verrucomicrobiales bacterium]